ncbi:MAG: hypothetical protein ACI8QC_002479 [Planctomycetota bacterium]|jgi:uncharacterized protein YbbC (DUF1343 family)
MVPAAWLVTFALSAIPAASPAGITPASTEGPPVRSGLDVLVAQKFAMLKGARIGLLTHAPGRDVRGQRGLDLLAAAPHVDLRRVFTPEHGLSSSFEGKLADGLDESSGMALVSLYGDNRRPTPEQLADLDLVVIDLQGAGVRFYTYATTMGYMLEACAQAQVPVMVLDRPNPLGGRLVEGPSADEDRLSFIAYRPVPVVHGMTMGELARLYRDHFGVSVSLAVVSMQGWKRSMRFEDTGLPWYAPSPNLRNPTQAYLYPGIGLLEATDLSVGRGTDEPFERIGAPWVDGVRLARALDAAGIPGLRFTPIEFTPDASKHEGQLCGGVQLRLDDLDALHPVAAGLAIARIVERLFPEPFDEAKVDERLMSRAAFATWLDGKPMGQPNSAFLEARARALLY